MKVKVGDTVKIIAGKDKGKEGQIIKTFKKDDKVLVQGQNMIKKHQKPNNQNETGGIIEREAPLHVSNVKVIKAGTKEKAPKKEVKETKPVTKTTKKAKKGE